MLINYIVRLNFYKTFIQDGLFIVLIIMFSLIINTYKNMNSIPIFIIYLLLVIKNKFMNNYLIYLVIQNIFNNEVFQKKNQQFIINRKTHYIVPLFISYTFFEKKKNRKFPIINKIYNINMEETKTFNSKLIAIVPQIFTLFDIFSVQPNYYFQKRSDYKTYIGALFTIIIFSLALCASIRNTKYNQNVNIISMNQQSTGFYYSFDSNNYDFGIKFYDKNNNRIFGNRNFTVEFICRRIDSKGLKIDKSIGTSTNCNQYGQYCLASQVKCPFYQLTNGETSFVIARISICNFETRFNCNLTFIQQYFNEYIVSVNYDNYQPDFDLPDWRKKFVQQKNHLTINYTFRSYMTFTKQQFNTNSKFLGVFELFNKKINGLKQRQLDITIGTLKRLNLTYGNTLAEYFIMPNNQIILMDKNFISLTNFLTLFVSIFGTLLFICKILIVKYKTNLLYLKIGNYFEYCVDQNKNIVNFDEISIRTFLFCLFYMETFKQYYPTKFIIYFNNHIHLSIKGKQKLNVNNFFNDIKQIMISEHQDIKIKNLNQQSSMIDIQQISQQELNYKIRQYIQLQLKTQISINQIQIFISWIQINAIQIQQIKQFANIIFNKSYKNNSNQLILQNYQQFKQQFNKSILDQNKQDLKTSKDDPYMETGIDFIKFYKKKDTGTQLKTVQSNQSQRKNIILEDKNLNIQQITQTKQNQDQKIDVKKRTKLRKQKSNKVTFFDENAGGQNH